MQLNENRKGEQDVVFMNYIALANTAKFSSGCSWKRYVCILEAAIYI
jgi:hypothetical protein